MMKLRTRLKLRNIYPAQEENFHIFHENLNARCHSCCNMKKKMPLSHHFLALKAPHPLEIPINPVSPHSPFIFLFAGCHVFLIMACNNNDFICAFEWQFGRARFVLTLQTTLSISFHCRLIRMKKIECGFKLSTYK